VIDWVSLPCVIQHRPSRVLARAGVVFFYSLWHGRLSALRTGCVSLFYLLSFSANVCGTQVRDDYRLEHDTGRGGAGAALSHLPAGLPPAGIHELGNTDGNPKRAHTHEAGKNPDDNAEAPTKRRRGSDQHEGSGALVVPLAEQGESDLEEGEIGEEGVHLVASASATPSSASSSSSSSPPPPPHSSSAAAAEQEEGEVMNHDQGQEELGGEANV
jgi:hypothetical protein